MATLNSTVETTSFATSKLDSPPLISIYYLPYENGEVQKITLYSQQSAQGNFVFDQI